jgi:EAL domain-containing protein (putative c-di-GMP-specific phosphodiesterase class I)
MHLGRHGNCAPVGRSGTPYGGPGSLWKRAGMTRAPQSLAPLAETRSAATTETWVRRIRHVVEGRSFETVYQPILDLAEGRMVAAEALSRFVTEPYRPPESWFSNAWRVGLGQELELATLDAALVRARGTMDNCSLAINLSPSVIAHGDLPRRLSAVGPAGVIIELTEHAAVQNYDEVRRAVARLRDHGVRLAVDDMGAGFASLRHIVKLSPDIVKLDRELVHDIDDAPVRRSLVTAMVTFAADIGSDIVAEGIETERELETVRSLGVRFGQGMFIGLPAPPEVLAATVRRDGALSPSRSPTLSQRQAHQEVESVLGDLEHALRHLIDAGLHGALGAKRAELVALDRAAVALACISERQPFVAGTTSWGADGC